MVKVAPSILSANFAVLGQEINDVIQGGADWIHIDVMDGHFVPNITMGPLVVEAIRPLTDLPLDVHLMIEEPEKYIQDFVKSGADLITVHQEACRHLHRTVYQIKEAGVKAGVAINPATPVEMVREILADVDLVLLMTVNPGFGGQTFIPTVLTKVKRCRQWAEEQGLSHLYLEVDGGVNEHTASLCRQAGANVLVAGSAIFSAADRREAINKIRG
ncbi:ribulose-phosphate 3-epimerase [Caldalkalibacillus thermarum TA2.A1]|uniref:Ribulose-phosphate 3-epimerase n=1 Tax=Caldalkalibacillus thermarum (strain TA2.A1) TaxID=986075 RepID=F5L7U2_CALTT|nr:ribulose-phosphate 3-epimerase [Caldalkalibacillus thermarum]EGL82601.1 ribulose-phosphate 3-epimerase [Caldalkalibacillus thermarum TA2.A1]QZT32804.1 ribulose-phosphate 3-epimerase [Caldalkalibacillus thermarum TA2.A1]GGK14218.1 ribulose-phosphate 3-epimerase [Caldalkalibacillus thermarum]